MIISDFFRRARLNDLHGLDTKLRIHYETFRLGGAGFWARIPREMVNQLPSGSIIRLGEANWLKIKVIDGDQIVASSLRGGTKTFNSVDCEEVCDAFILTKRPKYKPHTFEDVELTFLAFSLHLFPAVGILITAGNFLWSSPASLIIFILAICILALLTTYQVSGKTHLGFMCSTNNFCGSLLYHNPFIFKCLHPIRLGASYAIWILFSINANIADFQFCLVNLFVIFVNIYLLIHRMSTQIRYCEICNLTSVLILGIAAISIYEFWIMNKPSVVKSFGILFFLGIGSFVLNYITFNLVDSIVKLKKKAMQLKILTSDADIFNLLQRKIVQTTGLQYASILNEQKFIIYRRENNPHKENYMILHLTIGIGCEHCFNLLRQVMDTLDILDFDKVEVSIAAVTPFQEEANAILHDLVAVRQCPEKCKAVLVNKYLGRKIRVRMAQEAIATSQLVVQTDVVPIVFVNGMRLSNLFPIEDVVFHAIYSTNSVPLSRKR